MSEHVREMTEDEVRGMRIAGAGMWKHLRALTDAGHGHAAATVATLAYEMMMTRRGLVDDRIDGVLAQSAPLLRVCARALMLEHTDASAAQVDALLDEVDSGGSVGR